MSTISSFSNDNAQAVQANRPQGQTPPPRQDAPNSFEINDRYTPSNNAQGAENTTYANFGRSQASNQASSISSFSTMSASAVEDTSANTLEDVTDDVVEDSTDTDTNVDSNDTTTDTDSEVENESNSSTSLNTTIDVSELKIRYDELYTQGSDGLNVWDSAAGSANAQMYSSNLLTTQAELDSFKDGILNNIATQNKSLEIFQNMYAGNEISAEDNDFLYNNNKTMYGFAASHLLSQQNSNSNAGNNSDAEVDTDMSVTPNADASTDTSTDTNTETDVAVDSTTQTDTNV